MKKTVLLTGASGFVGAALRVRLLADPRYKLKSAVRKVGLSPLEGEEIVQIAGLDADTDWTHALRHVDVVVHTAARVHVMNDTEHDPLAAFRSINVEGTLRLARQAVAAGVSRFVFVSSIKVNGEGTLPGMSYRPDDPPAPMDPYGVSKAEAEEGLMQLSAESGLEVVIVRPVLVYGPGVKANFLSMMRWLDRGVILPFGSIHNRRSLVALENLVDLLVVCCSHEAAAGQRFLVSDDEDLSTTMLLRRMAEALDKSARLIPVPSSWLSGAARLLGKKAISQRLCGSLTVDISKTRELLDWYPPASVDQALRSTARHFKGHESK